ncbi:MAG: hypothetical protein KatS3mg108_0736 [Isosphaeraceae bacterium]|nr:MAG: hypothetical protein KatS3mg108_0736 [Isosphaeraceae bacterium]
MGGSNVTTRGAARCMPRRHHRPWDSACAMPWLFQPSLHRSPASWSKLVAAEGLIPSCPPHELFGLFRALLFDATDRLLCGYRAFCDAVAYIIFGEHLDGFP